MNYPGGTWVNFCWVCAAGLSEHLHHYSLFSTSSPGRFSQAREKRPGDEVGLFCGQL